MITTTRSRELRLAVRPHGLPGPENFAWAERPITTPAPGEVVVANTYLSVDPYMRGRMDAGPSYIAPWDLDTPLDGAAIGVVVESGAEQFPVGTVVEHQHSWREMAVGPAADFSPIDVAEVPPSTYLGALGIPGFTAWLGITRIAEVRAGETVLVSGAAGAVGSIAGQVARLSGAARVVGLAGSAEKIGYLTEVLGYDAAIDYRSGDLVAQLRNATPDGVDILFDNVGGSQLEAAIDVLNDFARIALCGAISRHNDTAPVPGPSNLFELIKRRTRAQGFIVIDHLDLLGEYRSIATGWLRDGALINSETVVDGLSAMPSALLDLYRGTNTGKMIVRLEESA